VANFSLSRAIIYLRKGFNAETCGSGQVRVHYFFKNINFAKSTISFEKDKSVRRGDKSFASTCIKSVSFQPRWTFTLQLGLYSSHRACCNRFKIRIRVILAKPRSGARILVTWRKRNFACRSEDPEDWRDGNVSIDIDGLSLKINN